MTEYVKIEPSVGRIVHYVSYGTPGGEFSSECRAAIIAGVNGPNNAVDLVVFNPGGLFFNKSAQREDEHVGGSWHWPERV
jgi:hypothetical protein